MNLNKPQGINPDTIDSNLFEMTCGFVCLILFRNLELSKVLEEHPEIHQQLVVGFEALISDVHLLAVVVVDCVEFVLD